MNKNYYTFGELLFGLRDEYLRTYELLDELKKYICVEGLKDDEFSLTPNENINTKAIRLNIIRNMNTINKIIERISLMKAGFSLNHNTKFILLDVDKNWHDYTSFKNGENENDELKEYKVGITDKNVHDELVEEIFNTKIMNLRKLFLSVNPFEKISVNNNFISLNCYYDSSDLLSSIFYVPNEDVIKSVFFKKADHFYLLDLLDTKIHKEYIPEEFQKIIEKSKRIHGPLVVSQFDYLDNNKMDRKYSIDLENNGVSLKQIKR